MEHIMQDIPFWEPMYLDCLKASAKAHHDHVLNSRSNKNYTILDIRNFLNNGHVKEFDKAFTIMFDKDNFYHSFIHLVETLAKTIIGKSILIVIPCDMSHCICVSKDNIYGIEFHKSVKCETTAFMTVYCQNHLSNINNGTSYFEGQWTYRVDNFLSSNFEVYLSETTKEISRGPLYIFRTKDDSYMNNSITDCTAIRLHAVYDSDDANYKFFVNDVKFAELEYSFKDFSESFEHFEYIENLCLFKKFKDANCLYSIFCEGLTHFGVKPNKLSLITAVTYNTNYCTFDEDFDEDECYNYIESAVAYDSGTLKAVQFNDESGNHWRIQSDYWSFCNDSIEVISYDGDIEIYTSTIIEDSDNDDVLKRNLLCTSTQKMFINFVFNVIKTAKTVYLPKYFPKK